MVPYCCPGSMVYHPLRLEPGPGVLGPYIKPPNFYRFARQYRFVPYFGSPTSGLIIHRRFWLHTHALANTACALVCR